MATIVMAKTIKEAKSNKKTIMERGLGLNNNMLAIRGIGTKKYPPMTGGLG
jgi:hypothetical protein